MTSKMLQIPHKIGRIFGILRKPDGTEYTKDEKEHLLNTKWKVLISTKNRNR